MSSASSRTQPVWPANHGLIILWTPPRVSANRATFNGLSAAVLPHCQLCCPRGSSKPSRVFSAATGHEEFIPFTTLPCMQASNRQRPWSHRWLGIERRRPHHHHTTTPCQDSSRLPSRSLGLVRRGDLGGLGGYRAALEGCCLSNGSRAVGGPGKGAELGSKGWKSAECRLIFFISPRESAVFEANGSPGGGAVFPH